MDCEIYRILVTNTKAEIRREDREPIHTTSDHGDFDRNLEAALTYLMQKKGRKPVMIETAPTVGISVAMSVLSKEYLVFTEPMPPEPVHHMSTMDV